jgi:glutathione S-transferase
MSTLTLVIGNKNYSSWSMRPWLVMRRAKIPFTEICVPLNTPETRERILRHSPSGRVPALLDGALTVWDSLAICEYLAERFPEARLWPEDPALRARARSVSCEMHSGFAALRQNLPLNLRAHLPGKGRGAPGVEPDIERILALWRECRAGGGAGGDFLFGAFSIADAFFAPVVSRFVTYGVALDGPARAYSEAVQALPEYQEWARGAAEEQERIEDYDNRL